MYACFYIYIFMYKMNSYYEHTHKYIKTHIDTCV